MQTPGYFDSPRILPNLEMEVEWTKNFHQLCAALAPYSRKSEKACVMVALTSLSFDKVKPNASEKQMKVILSSRARSLSKYSVAAIQEGLRNLVERSENPFFPTVREMSDYIAPVQNEFVKYATTLSRVLDENIKHKQPKVERTENEQSENSAAKG